MDILSPVLTKNLANPVVGIINTGLSIVRDKTKDADMSFIQENVKKGVSISSKRLLNLTGTGAAVTFALGDMATKGITKQNCVVLGLGFAYSLGMGILIYLSEKNKSA